MIRKNKAFGLVLVALLAIGAFAAQGVSAAPLTLEGHIPVGGKVFVHGDQDGGIQTLTTPHGEIKCTTATFLGEGVVETGGKVNEITVTPSYSGCTAFGFATAHVKTNGCTYTFTTPTQISPGVVTWHASTGLAGEVPAQIHVLCPTEKRIEVTPTAFGASVCTQFIAAQTPTMGHIVGKNAGGIGTNEMDVTLEITLANIHYTGTGGVCTDGTTHTDASLSGKSTVRCYSDEARKIQVGCTFS